ncbi:MAG: glycosyltransferase family 4 protein, partial [Candidatus Aenigmarchaeota archaeon]|nr:glycosyltransferase family 4 protein [Candidatus Aenigmarchaeota archaeon]
KYLKQEGILHYNINCIDSNTPQAIWKCTKEIGKLRKLKNIDVIHTNGLSHLFKAYIALKLQCHPKRTVIILTLHSSDTYSSSWGRQILKISGKLADIVIPLSKSSEQILLHIGIPKTKVVRLPNALNLQKFDILMREPLPNLDCLDFGDSTYKIVAYLAWLRPLKGHEYYLQAARIVLEKYPKTKFLVVGDGYIKNNLYQLAIELGIEDNIVFTGSLRNDAIPSLLSKVDIGISSSLAEQFPHSILELIAASKPVVATAVGGIPDIIIDCETGFLIPPRDSKALAGGIIKLLQDPENARQMGNRGRKLVEKEYDIEVITSRLQDIYKSSLNNILNR